MVLDDQKVTEIIEQFKAIKENSQAVQSLQQEIKDYKASNSDMFKTIAENLAIDVSEVKAEYANWVKLTDEGIDALENVSTIHEAIKTKLNLTKLEEDDE